MSKLILNKQTLADIADAVREKTGSEDLIAIEDLDDAVKHISGGNGGGVIEVDELPTPYLCTPVPNSGYVEKVYFDTSLSVEQVVAELKKLTYDQSGGCALLINNDYSTILLAMVNNGAYIIVDDEKMILYFSSVDMGSGQVGWNSAFNGEIEVNSEVVNADSEGLIGVENDKIANLFYITKQPNPKFDAEAIYKLSDETMWMWSVEEEKFVKLHKEQKVDVMKYSKFNNPDFGFYYGQTFMLDDPITIDIRPILEYMNANDASDFRLLHTINYGDEANPFTIDIPIDTGRSNDSINLAMGYNKLTIEFCYGYMDENGEFVRWSKDPNTNSYSGFGMYVASNDEPYSLIEYEQILDFNNMGECEYALANGMTFTIADVIRNGAERYENVDLADYTKWSRQFCMVSFNHNRGECSSYPQQNEWNQEYYEQDWEFRSLQSERNAMYKCLKIGK